MEVTLFDPLDPPDRIWLRSQESEQRYLQALATAGVSAMISNVKTQLLALRSMDRIFPVTVNHAEIGDSYVCLPHSAYILYALEELDFVDLGKVAVPLKLLIKLGEKFLNQGDINRIVHIDNWLLSTNLHGDWNGADLGNIRRHLTAKFPRHILAIRSVDYWSSANLLRNGLEDGWIALPSRQIWVTDDLDTNWRKKKATREDKRLTLRTPLSLETIDILRPDDAERISALYQLLYVDKYSPLNPIFTPSFIRMTHAKGILKYAGARNSDGTLMAVAGMFVRDDVLTPPIVGYDTGRPQTEGLYRIATFLFSDLAAQHGLRLNGSAGAPDFKRYRGAKPYIEYSLVYTRHLSFRRRLVVRSLERILSCLAVPMMRRYRL